MRLDYIKIFFICIAFYSFALGDESWLKNEKIKQQYEAYLTVDNYKDVPFETNILAQKRLHAAVNSPKISGYADEAFQKSRTGRGNS